MPIPAIHLLTIFKVIEQSHFQSLLYNLYNYFVRTFGLCSGRRQAYKQGGHIILYFEPLIFTTVDVHLTNVAIQKTAPDYDAEKVCDRNIKPVCN